MTANTDLMNEAKKSLQGNWGIAIGGMIVLFLVGIGAGFIPFGSLILAGPLGLGNIIFHKKIVSGEGAEIEHLFDGFKNFLPAFGTFIVTLIFVVLWSLLFIIPGIIMGFAYSQALFILSDEPDIGAYEAIQKSRAMMDGYKLKYFGLSLLFMLLSIACLFTLGIGYLFLVPFIRVTLVHFYQDVKADYEAMQPPAEPILES